MAKSDAAKAVKASGAAATDKTAAKQLQPFQFAPGQSGNPKGRPKGARSKLGEAFLDDMLAAWEAKGKDAIERVITERPHEFIKAVAGILPKEMEIKTTSLQELSDDDLAAALIALRSAASFANVGSGSETKARH